MAFPALLDACVLIPIRLADLLLRLAEADAYRPLWSEEILDEVERNLVTKFGLTADRAQRRLVGMTTSFPDAEVTGYQSLIPSMTNDHKDRHVLAAAVRADAAVIVTANLKDFPAESTKPYHIDVVHPDDFLLDQLDLYPGTTVRCVREQLLAKRNPRESVEEFVLRFSATVPTFAQELRRYL
ncbi:MAG: PIN domain-containing protein [Umezawaea sp.]